MLYNNTYGTAILCKKNLQGPEGPEGPQGLIGPTGPQGPSGTTLNSILFFNDITLEVNGGTPVESDLSYNSLITSNNGIERFVDNSNNITFENEIITDNAMVEIYSHCDALAGSSGQSNFIAIYLKCIDINDDTLQTIDIDTRSVQKGEQAHLTFGPTAYKLINGPNIEKPFTINKNSKYKLYIEVGRDYEIIELKLIIKLRN